MTSASVGQPTGLMAERVHGRYQRHIRAPADRGRVEQAHARSAITLGERGMVGPKERAVLSPVGDATGALASEPSRRAGEGGAAHDLTSRGERRGRNLGTQAALPVYRDGGACVARCCRSAVETQGERRGARERPWAVGTAGGRLGGRRPRRRTPSVPRGPSSVSAGSARPCGRVAQREDPRMSARKGPEEGTAGESAVIPAHHVSQCPTLSLSCSAQSHAPTLSCLVSFQP